MATVPTIAIPHSVEPLRLDLCISCQFVWFDPTEYEAWLRASAADATDAGLPAQTRAALARLPPGAAAVDRVDAHDSHSEPQGSSHFFRGAEFQEHADEEEFELRYLLCLFGLPVEVDPPPLRGRPWATWTLAGIVSAVSGLAVVLPSETARAWAFIPAEMWRHGGLTLITSFFLHGGWWHLLANMYFLVVLGDNVEDLLGWARYLALLLLGAIAGNLCHAAMHPSSSEAAVGASGGIAAVIVFYGLQFPRGRLKIGLRFLIVDVSVWVALALWVAVQLLGTFLERLVPDTSDVHVAYAAHLGGAVIGLIFWTLYGRGEPRLLRGATS